jgi:hypothetical protein
VSHRIPQKTDVQIAFSLLNKFSWGLSFNQMIKPFFAIKRYNKKPQIKNFGKLPKTLLLIISTIFLSKFKINFKFVLKLKKPSKSHILKRALLLAMI